MCKHGDTGTVWLLPESAKDEEFVYVEHPRAVYGSGIFMEPKDMPYYADKNGLMINESIGLTDDRCKFEIDDSLSEFVITDEAMQSMKDDFSRKA